MSESLLEKKDPGAKEASEKESSRKELQPVAPVVIWESEATFSVVPVGDQEQTDAPLLRLYTSGFGQRTIPSGKPVNGPIAGLRSAA